MVQRIVFLGVVGVPNTLSGAHYYMPIPLPLTVLPFPSAVDMIYPRSRILYVI